MKQTEIDYQVQLNSDVKFIALKNVADQHEIECELLPDKARWYYHGRSYYSLATIGELNTVRISNQHEPLRVRDGTGFSGYKDFKVGETYTVNDWDFFIHFLKAAGERYTKIHHAKEKSSLPIMTVKI